MIIERDYPSFNRPSGTEVEGDVLIPSDESLGYCQPSLRDERLSAEPTGRKPRRHLAISHSLCETLHYVREA